LHCRAADPRKEIDMFSWFNRILAPLALFTILSATGCTVDTEGTRQQRIDQLVDLADAVTSSDVDEELPYSCEIYGDCAYCEDRYRGGRCTVVCYGWACASGDEGGDCYDDCSMRAE